MKVYFSLLYDVWRIRKPKIAIECWLKYSMESDLRANDRFLSRMNVTSRNSSAFHANECIFSHNEEQKV